MRLYLATATLAAILLTTGFAKAADPGDIFIVGTTSKTADAVVAAVRSYSDEQEWVFISSNKVKQGQVTLVKICIPAVGKLVWPLGLKLSALLPCGNIGVYANGSATEISVLHPRYLSMLYPDPALEEAAMVAEPLLRDMLDAIVE
jgi:hypothetical protein